MKKIILMLVLSLFVGTSLATDWTKVSSNDNFTAYAERASITKTGTTTQMWGLFDDATWNTIHNVSYMSAGVLYEFDCESKQFRVLQAVAYSRHMGAGKIVDSSSVPSRLEDVNDHGSSGVLWKIACSKG
jgi:hypothetical protein